MAKPQTIKTLRPRDELLEDTDFKTLKDICDPFTRIVTNKRERGCHVGKTPETE